MRRPESTRSRERRNEAGSVSLMVISCAAVLMLLAAALAVTSGMVISHRRAQTVADLAALAGAETQRRGGAACAAATQIATSAQATLTGCELAGADVLVTVEVDGPAWRGRRWRLSARARAGPDPVQD